MQKFFPNYT